MTTQIIPWQDYADFTQTLRLSGEFYKLRARWNANKEFWTLDLFDSSGDPLLIGQKLVFNTDILARYNDPRLPPGNIFAIDTGNSTQKINKIGRNDIGVNVFVVYEEG